MITDEILAKALSAVRGITMTTAHGYNVSPADIARCYLTAVLPMIRAEVLEEAAKWHDAEAKRWNVELWERRSWGGPTIGEGECLEHIKAHEHSAATIRAMKGGEE